MSLESFGQKIGTLIERQYCEVIKTWVELFVPANPVYSVEETIHLLSMTGARNSYVNAVAKNLKMAGHDVQTGETALGRIRSLQSRELFTDMKQANNAVINRAVERGELDDGLVVAMDAHNVYRHTKIPMDADRKRTASDIRTVRGRKPKNGTCYAHEYMTVQNVQMRDEPTYVCAFDRVLPLQNTTDIARGLLRETTAKTNTSIELVMADGAFDDIDTLSMFMEEDLSFLVRADQDQRVKRVIEEKGDDYHIEYGYVKGDTKRHVTANLIVLNVAWLKEHGIKYPLKKKGHITFFTNLSPDENESEKSFCLKIARYYKKRWGIETGYRDISDFEAKTHSLSDAVRLFLYLQAILLYNLWVQINLTFQHDPERQKHFPDGIPKSTITFLIEQIIQEKVDDTSDA